MTGRFVCTLLMCALAPVPVAAQSVRTPTAGDVSFHVGGGGSVTFGALYDRATLGLQGTLGAAVVIAPGNSEAFELVGSATGSYFPNNGMSSGDFIIATGGIGFRLLANIDQTTHYYFELGGGIARVRERIHKSALTGLTVDGFVEWGPYFSPGIGIDTPVGKHLRFFTQANVVTIFGDRIGKYQYLQLIGGVRF